MTTEAVSPTADLDDIKVEVDHHEDSKGEDGPDVPDDDPRWLTGWKLWLSLLGMMFAQFMTSLVGNMLSPAFSIIVGNFNAASKFGWVSSAFFMAQCPCMLLYGQILSAFDGKKVLLSAIGFFTLGAVVCGSAQNIDAVIIGRAIAGIGAAGIWVGVLSLIASVVPLTRRPLIMGLFGFANLVANGCGPVLAGYFSDSVTWRLCFLFALPLAAITVTTIWFLVPKQQILRPFADHAAERLDKRWGKFSKSDPKRSSLGYRLLGVDWIGFVLVSGAVICLQMAIQDGGSAYAWTSGHILALIIGGFGGLLVVFIAWQWHEGEAALMPLVLFRNRTQFGGCLLSMSTLYANLIGVIMLPYFFEVALGSTALQAGYQILPYLLVTIVFSFVAGWVTTKTGHYYPWLIIGPCFMIVAGAVYYTMPSAPTTGQLYGYQILFAAGVGFTQQQIYVCIQAISKQEDIHLRIAAVSFAELFGGAIAPTISTTILRNKLAANLAKYAPDAPATVTSDTTLIGTLSTELAHAVRLAYIKSLQPIFIQLCAMGAISIIAAVVLIKPVNLKKVKMMGFAGH